MFIKPLSLTIAFLLCIMPAAHGQNVDSPPPCSAPEFRQLDFWVGDWNLWYDQGPNKPKGTAHNSITKDEYGACVITERFSMPGFTGTSLSIFHKGTGLWRQTWVDDSGNYFDLAGGPAPEGADFDFYLEQVHPKGMTSRHLRMIWQIKDEDNLVWRWQGRKTDQEDWQDLWVLYYERATDG